MNYEKEYNFVVNFLNKLNIQTTLFNIDEDEALLKLADQYNLSPQIFAQLKKYYTRIPFIKDKEYLLSLFMTFGESLWDGVDNYSIEKVNPNTFDYYDPATNNEKVKKKVPFL